jgi:arylsulfatase A-like enzyme
MTNDRPNIFLIHSDQFRGDCLGIDGHPCLMTPNLDHLAASGARMTKAYSECPICIPARHALMTGMAPDASGVVGFAMRTRIARPEATLPELLRRAGYQTAMVGRNMHTYPKGKRYGFETVAGDPFSEYYSRFHSIRPHSKQPAFQLWPHRHQHGMQNNGITAGPWPFDDEFHETNYSINKAMEFLDYRDPEAPFFLATGFVAPHPPFVPPRHYYDRYMQSELDEPFIGEWTERPANNGRGLPVGCGKQVLEGERSRQARAGYYGLINHIDDQLCLLMERVQSEPNTYVFFISDHGEMLGDHYFFRKSCPYESSMRVPFLLSGPDIEANQVIDEVVGLQDILPTCCDIAGIETPEHVTGKSLWPLINGAGSSSWREYLHGEHAPMDDQHPGWHALVGKRWKYIWFNDGREQLFDLSNDPKELHDLAFSKEHADQLLELRTQLILKLEDRPEGFSDGEQLIPGRPYAHVMPHALTDA